MSFSPFVVSCVLVAIRWFVFVVGRLLVFVCRLLGDVCVLLFVQM